jgi:carboxypeptidase family protein
MVSHQELLMRTGPDHCWRVLVILALFAGGCGNAPTAPTAPSQPGPTFSLTGSVTESAPTQDTRLAGATIVLHGSPDGSRPVTTDATGAFAIPGLQRATFTVQIQAAGYVEQFVNVTLDRDQRIEVQLDPVLQTLTTTTSDSITNGGGCPGYWDDLTLSNPCAAMQVINVHYAGTLTGAVAWSDQSVGLVAELYRSDGGHPVGSPTTVDERTAIALSAHRQYVIRVTKYSSGGGSAPAGTTPFTLVLTRPN